MEKLSALGLALHVVTADTNGTGEAECTDLSVEIHLFPREAVAAEKERLVRQLGKDRTACLGNGKNDLLMVQNAVLSIAVISRESIYRKKDLASDLWIFDSLDGLGLLLKPHHLIARG